jgi:hypothetical protein
MAITENQIKYGPVVKVAGQSEEVGLDVLEEAGKKRAYVSAIERGNDFSTAAVSVGTSQVAMQVGGTPLTNRRGIHIQNLGTGSIYIGKTGVLTTTGIKVPPESAMYLAVSENVIVYAIAAAGTQDVRVMEVS